MSIVSFTGVGRELTPTERRIVEDTVGDLRPPQAFFSGAAVGVDIWAAACAIKLFPDSKHVVVVPHWYSAPDKRPRRCEHDRDGVARLVVTAKKYGASIRVVGREYAAVGDEATGFLRRNDVLAINCTHMVAFPNGPEEVQRSGTWSTVRRARRLERKILIVPLDGTKPFRDGV